MNRSIETVIRFVNLTASGLLAGSLGFGESALTPGWEAERPQHHQWNAMPASAAKYFNSIGPVALATSMTLAIGSRNQTSARRTLDVLATLGLTGVLAATMFVTVPITRKLDTLTPVDYPSSDSETLRKNWELAHSMRTACGIGAFVCAVMSNVAKREVRS
ncbi:MAG: DUF1772 domain-containing protein [Acidobacteriota bacterium]